VYGQLQEQRIFSTLTYMFVKMTVQFQGQNFFKTILKEIKTASIMESIFLLFFRSKA